MIDITLTLQNSMPVKGEPFRSRFRIFQIDGSIGQPPGFLIVIIRIARVQISADRHFGLRFAVGKLVRQLRHAVSTLRYARQILARVTVGYVGCNRRRRIFQLDALQFPIIIGVPSPNSNVTVRCVLVPIRSECPRCSVSGESSPKPNVTLFTFFT